MSLGLTEVLREAAGLFRARGVGFAVVGGLAVSVRTEPRFTRDVDLAVAVTDDQEAETVVAALAPPYEPVAILEHATLERIAAVRLGRGDMPTAGVVVDLLFASSGIEQEVVETAEPLEVFPDVSVPVARTGHLLALKLLARDDTRPLDAADLQGLLAVADAEELTRAEHLLALIMRRGTNRGRDLPEEWRTLIAGSAGGRRS